jgi:uncharacterized delta-60 repeat protein
VLRSDATVEVLAVMETGHILVGGNFSSINGQAAYNLARLNSDGSLDPSFNAEAANLGWTTSMVVQRDGKLLVCCGGNADVGSSPVLRLMTDGGIDPTFRPEITQILGHPGLAEQPDGKVLVTGLITFEDNIERPGPVRLNPDGSLDLSFNAGVGLPWDGVVSVAVQRDGEILLGGSFDLVNGLPRGGLARLHGNAPPPGFSDIRRMDDGSAALTLHGVPQESYRIEGSVDLRTWHEVGEAAVQTGASDYKMVFRHTQAADFPLLFYRAHQRARY